MTENTVPAVNVTFSDRHQPSYTNRRYGGKHICASSGRQENQHVSIVQSHSHLLLVLCFPSSRTIFLFSKLCHFCSIQVSFKGRSQHIGCAWANSLGTEDFNIINATISARSSCTVKFLFESKLINSQRIQCFYRRKAGAGHCEGEGHSAQPLLNLLSPVK